MESLPFALRVAAGVVAESIDLVRKLPTEISTLPVTVMGTLAKLSFQLNQELTDLASAGDRLLAGIRGGEEPPARTAWATIDDEDETARDDPQAAATWDSVADARDDEVRDRVEPTDAGAVDSPDAAENDDSGSIEAELDASSIDPGVVEAALAEGDDAPVVFEETDELTHPLVEDVTLLAVIDGGADDEVADDATDQPRKLTLSELRTALQEMSADDVRAALEDEQQHRARPAHLTLLTNRLATLGRNPG